MSGPTKTAEVFAEALRQEVRKSTQIDREGPRAPPGHSAAREPLETPEARSERIWRAIQAAAAR